MGERQQQAEGAKDVLPIGGLDFSLGAFDRRIRVPRGDRSMGRGASGRRTCLALARRDVIGCVRGDSAGLRESLRRKETLLNLVEVYRQSSGEVKEGWRRRVDSSCSAARGLQPALSTTSLSSSPRTQQNVALLSLTIYSVAIRHLGRCDCRCLHDSTRTSRQAARRPLGPLSNVSPSLTIWTYHLPVRLSFH